VPIDALSDLDPELYRTIQLRAKRQIRQRMSALRRALPADALAQRSAALTQRVLELPLFEAARSVALFWPMLARNETDLRDLDAQSRAFGKRVYYPFMTDQGETLHTGFRLSEDAALLCEQGRGFCEPPLGAPVAGSGDLDLILVPALAAAPSGHRVGYGAGFYDATLPEFCPPARSVIVIFDFQLLGELPVSPVDVPCDLVVTDKRVFERAASA
jgi:5-formyltetrahydrofolate cyclo-ligase